MFHLLVMSNSIYPLYLVDVLRASCCTFFAPNDVRHLHGLNVVIWKTHSPFEEICLPKG